MGDGTDHEPATWSNLLAEGRLPRFVLICLGVWMNAADSLVTATIMPSVGADLDGYAYFSWAVAGFLVGAIVAGASAGRLSEIVGLRRATVFSGLVFGAGCMLSALAPNISMFLVGRVIQGIGSGWISGLAMVAIAFLFPERHLARVFGSVAAVWGVATVLGPLLGGAAAELGDWRVVFWLFAAQAIIFSLAALPLLRGNIVPPRALRVPWLQLAILLLAIGAIGVADVSGSPVKALLCGVVGLALLFAMLRIDARAAAHLLPRHVADLRTTGGSGYAAMFALMATAVGFLIYGPAILQRLHGFSPLMGGIFGGRARHGLDGRRDLCGGITTGRGQSLDQDRFALRPGGAGPARADDAGRPGRADHRLGGDHGGGLWPVVGADEPARAGVAFG